MVVISLGVLAGLALGRGVDHEVLRLDGAHEAQRRVEALALALGDIVTRNGCGGTVLDEVR